MTQPIMTPEKLANHLFGGRQVTFWNYEPHLITSGIEVEYIISRQTPGDDLQLATQQDFKSVIDYCIRKFGYADRRIPDQPGRISKDSPGGYIIIKPDYAWHILEISLSPANETKGHVDKLTQILSEVDEALTAVNLKRQNFSCLPHPIANFEQVNLQRLQNHDALVKQPNSSNVTINPNFPAYIAATHVHLNASNQAALALLPNLYSFEEVAMTLYTRAKNFGGQSFRNVRSELYKNTLGDNYRLHTIPKKVPTSLAELVAAMNESPHLFPNDPFFPVRDLSYIRPSKIGTFEFRSTCSYHDPVQIGKIVIFRKAQLIASALPKPQQDRQQKSETSQLLDALTRLEEANECSTIIDLVRNDLKALDQSQTAA